MDFSGIRDDSTNYSMEVGKLIHSYFEDESIVESFELIKPSYYNLKF